MAAAGERRHLSLHDLSDGHPFDQEVLGNAEVSLHQDADGVAIVSDRDASRRGPDPALEPEQNHPGAATDVALRHGPSGGVIKGGNDMLPPHVLTGGVVEHPIERLGHHGHHEVFGADPRLSLRQPLDTGLMNGPDREGVGQEDRRIQETRFVHLGAPGDLSGSVQDSDRGRDPGGESRPLVGVDGGHPRANRSLADLQRPLTVDDCGVTDAHAGDIRDRVQGTRWERADRDPEVPEPPSFPCPVAPGLGAHQFLPRQVPA